MYLRRRNNFLCEAIRFRRWIIYVSIKPCRPNYSYAKNNTSCLSQSRLLETANKYDIMRLWRKTILSSFEGRKPLFFYILFKIRLNHFQYSLEILVLSGFLFAGIQILNLAIKTSLRSNFGRFGACLLRQSTPKMQNTQ